MRHAGGGGGREKRNIIFNDCYSKRKILDFGSSPVDEMDGGVTIQRQIQGERGEL